MISVVVPTRNERHNLPYLIASLPRDVELVVCDDSDDDTPAIARRLRPRNTVVVPGPGGIAAARQIGAEAARGDILVFSDADVCFAGDYFDLVAHLPDWEAICGPKLSRDRYALYYRLVAASQRAAFVLSGLAVASGSNMAIRRAAFERLGGFRPELPCNEDTELFLRAGRRGLRVQFEPELIVYARDHRRLHRGLLWKSAHGLARNAVILATCNRAELPRILRDDWAYWSTTTTVRR